MPLRGHLAWQGECADWVFNVGGNNYRLVVIVRYRVRKIFVQQVMTTLPHQALAFRRGSGDSWF